MELTPEAAALPPHGHEIPVHQRLDLEVVRGSGTRLVTADGREFIDFYGGHAVAALGHAPPALVEALSTQAARLLFQSNAVELAVRREASAALARYAPAGLDQVFFVSSGAEANENALRLAFRARSGTRVVAVEGGFHGRTAAAAACTHGAREKWYAFPRTPFDVTFVPREDHAALADALDEDVAAVIVEPVQGIGGAVALSPGFLRALADGARAVGAAFIADEVQCGMGRTGTRFAIEAAGVLPDLLTTAKGLGGGFPVGAVVATAEIAGHVGPGDLGTTFGAGPLACAMVTAVIRELERPGLLENVRAAEAAIRALAGRGPVQSVSGRGLLLGLRCDRPARDVLAALRAQGILAGGSGDPAVVRLLPPLTIGSEEIARLAEALDRIGAAS